MTTNKPRAGEAIVKVVEGPLGEKLFICTDQFWKYLDELDTDSGDATEEPIVINPAFGVTESRLRALESSKTFSALMLAERLNRLEVQPSGPTHTKIKNVENDSIPTGGTTYTTTGDVFLDCLNTAAATVELNDYPYDGEDAIISRTDGGITVNGPINGGTTLVMGAPPATAHLKYSYASSEWRIV